MIQRFRIKETIVIVLVSILFIVGFMFFVTDLTEKINSYLYNKIEGNTTIPIESLESQIQKLLEQQKFTKINLEQKLRQINIVVINQSSGSLGSGVSIKYNGEYYILTAGHMLNNKDDIIYLYENKTQICKLEVVKWDYPEEGLDENGNDLLLLKPTNNNIIPRYYTELAEREPIIGTQIYVVGNPMGLEDVITDGRNVSYENNFMYYIAPTYFGNSGGGVYDYNGKVIGIVSHMRNLKPMEGVPDYVINGAVRLDTIMEFLKDIE